MKRLRRFPGIAIPGLLVLFSYYLLFGTEGANGAERDKQERRFFSFVPSAPLRLCSEKKASGFRLQASGLRLQASGFRLQASGFRLQASGFRLQASGIRLQASGFRRQPSSSFSSSSSSSAFHLFG
jgi:hypothetical protein